MAKKAKAKKAVKKVARKVAKAAPKRVEAIPSNMPQLTPYFWVSNAGAAIDFYKQVLGARVMNLMKGPDGKVAHCSLKIGNAVLNLSEPMGTGNNFAAGKSSGVMLYVKDTNAVFNKAVSLGAKVMMPVADMFWGDRWGMLEDPFGNVWQIATHLEDVKPAEMGKRMAAMMPPGGMDAGTPPPPPSDVTTQMATAQA